MVRKKDWLIVLLALALAGAALCAMRFAQGGPGEARSVSVYVNGALFETVPLGAEREIRVEQEDGCVNVIAVTRDGAFMKSSSCHNQLCVEQGAVTRDNWRLRALGRQIVCLPNRVVVELSPDGAEPALDAPDV